MPAGPYMACMSGTREATLHPKATPGTEAMRCRTCARLGLVRLYSLISRYVIYISTGCLSQINCIL